MAWVSTCLLSSAASASSATPTLTTPAPTATLLGPKSRAEIFLGVSLKSIERSELSPANATRYYDGLEGVALECLVAPVKGGRGPATSWNGFDEAAAGGPVRDLTTSRIKVTGRGIDAVEGHVSRFGPDAANGHMIDRLRGISNGKLSATAQDLNFYSHELREFVRYRRLGWKNGVPGDSDAAMNLWRQTHTGTLGDYNLPLHADELLYHPDALKLLWK